MKKAVKYLSWLFVGVTLAQILGKFFYFDCFRLFTFKVGYLSLVETGLVFLFVCFFQKQLDLFPDQKKLKEVRLRSRVLFLLLPFFAGVHLVGGEFQNFFILEKSFGPQMDMATFYDGIGHLFLFLTVLVLVYWLVKSEIFQSLDRELSTGEVSLVLIQSLLFSFGFALTIVKSAFILLCLIPILVLTLSFVSLSRRRKAFSLRSSPLYLFFTTALLLTFVWLLAWLVLPSGAKKPIVEEYISLPGDYKIETTLNEIPCLKSIIRVWD